MSDFSRRCRTCRRASVAVLAIWLVATASFAQVTDVPPGPLTLDQVLDLAEARSESIALARLALQRVDVERARTLSPKYPQLSASATYDRSITNEFAGVFTSNNSSSCPAFALNQASSLDARVKEIERAIDCGAIGNLFGGSGDSNDDNGFANLPFGRANTWRATLSFSQNLYVGGRIGAAMKV